MARGAPRECRASRAPPQKCGAFSLPVRFRCPTAWLFQDFGSGRRDCGRCRDGAALTEVKRLTRMRQGGHGVDKKLSLASCLVLAAAAANVQAQQSPGVTATTIVIGQSAPLTGA